MELDVLLYLCCSNLANICLSVVELEKHWSSLRTMYQRAIEIRASGSGAKDLTQRQKYLLRRLNFIAPFTKGAEAVVSSLDLDSDVSFLFICVFAENRQETAGRSGVWVRRLKLKAEISGPTPASPFSFSDEGDAFQIINHISQTRDKIQQVGMV